jgi:hypothetical protein
MPSPDLQILEVLLESGKKIDKIIMYCLLCMPTSLQYVSEVQKIFQMALNNIALIDSLVIQQQKHQLSSFLESYMAGVLEQVFKVQSLYPFLLVDIL